MKMNPKEKVAENLYRKNSDGDFVKVTKKQALQQMRRDADYHFILRTDEKPVWQLSDGIKAIVTHKPDEDVSIFHVGEDVPTECIRYEPTEYFWEFLVDLKDLIHDVGRVREFASHLGNEEFTPGAEDWGYKYHPKAPRYENACAIEIYYLMLNSFEKDVEPWEDYDAIRRLFMEAYKQTDEEPDNYLRWLSEEKE